MKAIFHGELANKFGSEHTFQAATITLLVQGLILQLGGEFRDYFAAGKWVISINGEQLAPEQMMQKFDPSVEVHIQPVVAGESTAAKIIIGAVLIYITLGSATPWVIAHAAAIQAVGAGLIMQGITGMLTKTPTIPSFSGSAQNPNYFFNGGTNTNTEGAPVPLVYGRVQRAGSVVISNGITIGQVS
jgi:predicted phage tail protein